MATITKKELAYRIAETTGQKKVVVREVIQLFIDEIIGELAAGNRLEFREFGVFEIKTRAARQARNPRTGQPVSVPGKAVVHFRAGRQMKQRVQDAVDSGALEDLIERQELLRERQAARAAERAEARKRPQEPMLDDEDFEDESL